MNHKTTLLLLISVLLIPHYTVALVNPAGNKLTDDLEKQLERAEDGPGKVDILKNLCWEYRHLDREKALEYGNRGLKLAEKINYQIGIAKCLNNIGIVYADRGDYDQALNYYMQSLAIKKKIGDLTGIVSSFNNIGTIHSQKGDHNQALKYYENGLEKSKELGNEAYIAFFYNNLGQTHKLLGNLRQALDFLEKGLAIRKKLGDQKNILKTYLNIGDIYRDLGDYQKIKEYYDKSLKMSEKLRDIKGIADSYQNLGTYHFFLREYQQALDCYSKSLKINEEIDNKKNRASILHNIALIYHDKGEYKKALDKAEECLKLEEELKNGKGMVEAWNAMAISHNSMGDFKIAIDYLKKALEVAKELHSEKLKAITLNNMANANSHQGNHVKAIEYYFESLKIKEKLEDKLGIISTHINIGDFYLHQRADYDNAKKHYNDALKISRDLKDNNNIGWVYNKMGDFYYRKEDYNQAEEYYSKSLEIRKKLGVRYSIAESYFCMGQIELDRGNYRQALTYLSKSLEINEEIENTPGIASSCQAIGKCYGHLGETGEAIKFLTRAFTITKKIKIPEIEKEAAEGLSDVYAGQNRFKEAYQFHVLFKETSDSLRNDKHVKKITQLQMQAVFDKEQQVQEMIQKEKDLQKEAEIKRQKMLSWTYFGGFIFMFVLAVVIFRSYRHKQKANRLLAKQQKEIEHQRDKLHELNVTKDKFFSIIAHDLKNPFSALIGFSKTMITEFEHFQKEQIKEFLQSVYKSSENTYNLLENLLEWARSQTGKLQWNPVNVELGEVAEYTIDLLKRNAANKNIQLLNEINGKAFVFTDKNILYTVFRNLISNAIKFTPDGGLVKIDSRKVNGFIEIRVVDTGIGIASEDIEKLFRIDVHFSRTGTRNEQGTGLGLILCKEFIEKSGGKIWVESQVGKGTTFIFTFPALENH